MFGLPSPVPSPALGLVWEGRIPLPTPDLPVVYVPGVDTAEDVTSSVPTACGGSPLLDTLAGAERLRQEPAVDVEVWDGPAWLLRESQSTEPKLEVSFWPLGRSEEGGMAGRRGQLWVCLGMDGGGRARGLQRDRRPEGAGAVWAGQGPAGRKHGVYLGFSRAGRHLYLRRRRGWEAHLHGWLKCPPDK